MWGHRKILAPSIFLLLLRALISLLYMTVFGAAHSGENRGSSGWCSYCPYFINTNTNITSPQGLPINLTCGVRNLMDRKVSWIRRKDLHVLTTGNLLYTTDVRFKVLHLAGSPYWTLEVASPTLDDAGVYECQVSTQPKIYQRFYLNIIVPKAEITGTQQLFMKAGSNINITCLVTGAVRGTLIKWYHILPRPRNGVSLTELNIGDRGGVQLVTDKNRGSSWLLVSNASWKDAGNYTCAPEYSQPASITVHILNEETPAAMQHDLQPSSEGRKSSLSLYHLTAIFSILNIISIFLLEGRTWTLISQSELMRTLVCLTCLLSCLI